MRVLTTEPDNLPGWSPDGSRIVFTRREADGNYNVFTIQPDGSDLRRLTNSPAVMDMRYGAPTASTSCGTAACMDGGTKPHSTTTPFNHTRLFS